MKDKPTILIADNSQYVTGALKAIVHSSLFHKNLFKFLFILPVDSTAVEYLKEKGFDVIELPFVELNKKWYNLLLYLPMLFLNGYRINRVIRKNKVSLLHVNDFYNLAGIVAKVMVRHCRLVAHVRFMPDRFPSVLVKTWLYINLKWVDKLIVVSQAVKRQLPAHPKVQLIYDGLFLLPENMKRSKMTGVINLLYLAHYIPGKGQDLALEAFAIAYQHNNRLRLKFVGGDFNFAKSRRFKQDLKDRAEKLGVHPVVTFAGPATSIHDEYLSADVFLNFSESESFSMTCLEALAYGTPVIVSNCGGPAELFEDGISGYLVPNKDIKAMCEAILKVSADTVLMEKLSLNGSLYIQEKFSANETYNKLTNLYNEVLMV